MTGQQNKNAWVWFRLCNGVEPAPSCSQHFLVCAGGLGKRGELELLEHTGEAGKALKKNLKEAETFPDPFILLPSPLCCCAHRPCVCPSVLAAWAPLMAAELPWLPGSVFLPEKLRWPLNYRAINPGLYLACMECSSNPCRGAEIPAWCSEKWPLTFCFQTQTLGGIMALRGFFFPAFGLFRFLWHWGKWKEIV